MRMCGLAIALAIGFAVATSFAADEVKSGPTKRIGGAFDVKAITGDKAGRRLCYV